MAPTRQRNHYIPRMLLNRFASRREGEASWIWQISREGNAKEISTRHAAVGSLFYGKSDSGVEEALARIESHFAPILETMDRGGQPADFEDALRQFVYLLFIRTRALREHFIDSTRRGLEKLAGGLTSERVNSAVKREVTKSLDTLMIDAAAQLPAAQGQIVRAWAKDSKALNLMKSLVIQQTETGVPGELLKNLLSSLRGHPALMKSARDGQIRGLARLLENSRVPDLFRPESWHIVRQSGGFFVLGDCCAFAQSGSGKYGSLLRFSNEWSAVFLPLSSSQLLVGSRDGACPPTHIDQVNAVSARLSRRYLYSAEKTESVLALAQSIGTAPALISDEELDLTMEDVWKEFDETNRQ